MFGRVTLSQRRPRTDLSGAALARGALPGVMDGITKRLPSAEASNEATV
jgi:hypothetical protein